MVKPSLYVQPLLLENLHGLSSAYLAKPQQCQEADTTETVQTREYRGRSSISLGCVYVHVVLFLRSSRSVGLRLIPLS